MFIHFHRPPAGERCAFFLGPVPEDKLPKDATPGRVLVGSLTVGQQSHKGEAAPAGAQVRAGRGGPGGGGLRVFAAVNWSALLFAVLCAVVCCGCGCRAR